MNGPASLFSLHAGSPRKGTPANGTPEHPEPLQVAPCRTGVRGHGMGVSWTAQERRLTGQPLHTIGPVWARAQCLRGVEDTQRRLSK